MINKTTTVAFIECPYTITQGTSGTGGFTTLNGPSSLTASNTFEMTPFQLGTRMYEMAGQFLQWRIKKLNFTYTPWASASGVASVPGGTTSTPNYSSRPFCWGFVMDPAILTLTYITLRGFGGRFGQTDRSSSLSLAGKAVGRWLYTSTTVAGGSATTLDFRSASPGQLRWYFGDTSTTNTQTHGVISMNAVVQFRWPSYNALPIGVPSLPDEDEKKDTESPILVPLQSLTIKTHKHFLPEDQSMLMTSSSRLTNGVSKLQKSLSKQQ